MAKHIQNPSGEAISGDGYIHDDNNDLGGVRDESSIRSAGSEARRTSPSLVGRLWYWWSLTAAALILLVVAPPVIIVCRLLNRREWLYPWAHFGGRLWLRLSGTDWNIKGLEKLDPNRTYIFAANHRSYLDTSVLFNCINRRIGLFAKKELLKVPIFGYGMGYVNIMAIDRSSLERAATTVRAATDKIRSGRSFGVFVEGRRARPGELLPFKKGAFYMAVETGTPVVPVVFKNTDELMGKGTGEAKPGTIEVVFLDPVEVEGLSGEDVKGLTEKVRMLIADELKPSKM